MMRPVTCIYYYPIINGAVAGKFSTSWSDEDWAGRAELQKKWLIIRLEESRMGILDALLWQNHHHLHYMKL